MSIMKKEESIASWQLDGNQNHSSILQLQGRS